jgi:hypothetical protein
LQTLWAPHQRHQQAFTVVTQSGFEIALQTHFEQPQAGLCQHQTDDHHYADQTEAQTALDRPHCACPAEQVTLTTTGFDHAFAKLAPQVVDVNFEDIGITLGFTVIKVFGEMTFRQDLLWVQHEIAQQTEFGGSQLNVGTVAGDTLAAFVQVQTGSP